MRSLTATALTLAFMVMAAITYVAVTGDPMGGEPRLLVKLAPSDQSLLQSPPAKPAVATTAPAPQSAPIPVVTVLGKPENQAAAGGAQPAATMAPITGAQSPQPAAAGGVTSTANAIPRAAPPSSEPDADMAGVGLSIPN